MNRNLHISKLFLEIQSGIFSLDFSKITFREDIIHPSQTNSIEENERIVSENPNTPYVDLMYFTKEQYTGIIETTQDNDIFVRMNIMGIKYNEDDVTQSREYHRVLELYETLHSINPTLYKQKYPDEYVSSYTPEFNLCVEDKNMDIEIFLYIREFTDDMLNAIIKFLFA